MPVTPLGVGHDPSGRCLGQGEECEQGKADGRHGQDVRAPQGSSVVAWVCHRAQFLCGSLPLESGISSSLPLSPTMCET